LTNEISIERICSQFMTLTNCPVISVTENILRVSHWWVGGAPRAGPAGDAENSRPKSILRADLGPTGTVVKGKASAVVAATLA